LLRLIGIGVTGQPRSSDRDRGRASSMMDGMSERLARCTERGCPVVFRDGSTDRPCPMHLDDATQLAARAAGFGVMMTSAHAGHDGDDEQPEWPPRRSHH
jgi:hypothetical protein